MSRVRREHGPRLSRRIFGAMGLVVVAGAGTLVVVSLLLAPAIFYYHLEQGGLIRDDTLTRHVDEGFATAILVSTVVGVVIASGVAAIMAALVSRRISEPVAVAARATSLLANGDYSARVPSPRMGPELAALAEGVNSLAMRLEATEVTRARLISDIAHELRTPLAAIDATVEAIADGVLATDDQTLAALTDNANRLSRLVEDLASVSRAEERSFLLARRTSDLADTARGAVAQAGDRFVAAGIALTGPTGRGRSPTWTPIASARSSGSCSTTPCGPALREMQCRCRSPAAVRRRPSRSPIPAGGSIRTTPSCSSSGSTGKGHRLLRAPEAGSGSPSHEPWLPLTAGRSRPPAPDAGSAPPSP